MNKEITPSQRVADIKEYYFSIKLREVAAMKAAGIDVVSLGVGGPDQAPSPETIEALISGVSDPQSHGYQSHNGIPELRRAFADWYKRWYGVSLDLKSEVLPLIGSKEGVLHISLAFVNPGDTVLVPDPGYPAYTSVNKMLGARIVKYPLKQENGWQPDFDALERMDLTGVKLMWLNYPHMPTGAPAQMETFRRAVEFGRRHGILIVNDNPYSFILNDNPLSIMQTEGAKDVAIEMNSLSKSHNMPGWRVGVAVSNPRFISYILKVKSNIDSGQFKPMMLAAAKALEAGPEWYTEVNTLYGERRKVAEKIMDALDCDFDPTQAGLFLWGKIRNPELTAEQLADRLLHDAHIFLTPGFIFGENGDGYIRISLCAPVARLEEALRRINALSAKS